MAEKKKLSYEEKLQAVLYCIGHRLDYRQASEQYKITYQQIYNWVKKYQEQGETGLLDRRGKRRPPDEYSEEEKAAAKLRKLKVSWTSWTTRQYRLNHIHRNTFILIPCTETTEHEVHHIGNHILICEFITEKCG